MDMPNSRAALSQSLADVFARFPGLVFLDDPDALAYYRQDLNADLPPLLRDLLLRSAPEGVLLPSREEEICAVLSLCQARRIPVTVRGAGTWGYGGAVPTQGGLLLDLGRMDEIAVDPGSGRVHVGPGARFADIDAALEVHGLRLLTTPSGKGGTLAGWIATGGCGLGTLRHGPVRRQILSLRVVLPTGAVREVEGSHPDLDLFVGTEGQMGIIVRAALRVGPRPSAWIPAVACFPDAAAAYAFAGDVASRTGLCPEDLAVYHPGLLHALRDGRGEAPLFPDGVAVFAVFSGSDEARRFAEFASRRGRVPDDPGLARMLWEERYLPMAVKRTGPSLLAAEVSLPVGEAAAFAATLDDWGTRLGVRFLPGAHLTSPTEVLFLALIAADSRETAFYVDLVLVPLLVRLAIQRHRGKPYGVGIWNTPFLRDLYPPAERKRLAAWKKRADPAAVLNGGKFFGPAGRLAGLQKALFQPDLFHLELATLQWLLLRLFSLLPPRLLRRRIVLAPADLAGLDDEIRSCAQCGVCVGRCPLYHAVRRETLTARGKLLALRRALDTKRVSLGELLPLYLCLRCGRCDEGCQAGFRHRDLFARVEAVLANRIPFPLAEIGAFVRQVEESPEFSRFLDVVRTGFDQKIQEARQTFPKYRVAIDEEICLHCGTCVDACMFSVRRRSETDPRRVVVADELLCRGCGACIERCPQLAAGRAATSVELHPDYLGLDDPYWGREVVGRIDLEATTGKIPVSGTGQGDPHRGKGNDGIRFGHFHIVGPAQNLLYESSADTVAVQLGRRPKYLTFQDGRIATPTFPFVALRTPLLLDAPPAAVGEDLFAAMAEAAEAAGTRLTVTLADWETRRGVLQGKGRRLLLRLAFSEAARLGQGMPWPGGLENDLPDLVEISYAPALLDESAAWRDRFPASTVFAVALAVQTEDIDGQLQPKPALREILSRLEASPFDVVLLTSEFDPSLGAYPTTAAVPAVHRFFVERKIRHRFSLVAAGGIRSAADTQKTVQRGANAVKIDWPILLAADPRARQKAAAGEALRSACDRDGLARRFTNLLRVWNVQIVEVLGASGFKDIKKTVGEENRLLIFDDLEEQVSALTGDPARRDRNRRVNAARMSREGEGRGWRYGELQRMIRPVAFPHRFYRLDLKAACYGIFDGDHVWPAALIASAGRMASGDPASLLLANAPERGNLGDGFDVMRLNFREDPDRIPEERLQDVSTSLQLAPGLVVKMPFVGAGMSVGSIGPGTWRARVLATRTLETQMDTGEGGYPTVYILNERWDPLDFSEAEAALLGKILPERTLLSAREAAARAEAEGGGAAGALGRRLRALPPETLIQYVPIVTREDRPYVSTQLKTGLFGVTKETIRRARRVVIAYSQGAKQGVGGHLLGRKVFGLVSLLRGVAEGTSLISPFPFHNCYSIEDVKAFIDAVRMIHPETAVCIKVSPSPDIPFIVSGLGRIARDNGMVVEAWLDGPRGGTGAAPDIIKGQMGMHMEYAIPLCHEKLLDDGLRDHVVFLGSGGFRTWGDVAKGIALGLDGVILGTADLVAIGCVRDRNCESGCRSGISTVDPKMQVLRDVDTNAQQIVNFRAALQAQLIRVLAALGLRDVRELRGRYDLVAWPALEERVAERRKEREAKRPVKGAPQDGGPEEAIGNDRREEGAGFRGQGRVGRPEKTPGDSRAGRGGRGRDRAGEAGAAERASGTSPAAAPLSGGAAHEEENPGGPADCGVAAIVSNRFIPSHVMDLMLERMANRGMDGVGCWKGGCYPDRRDRYALHVLVKGALQTEVEETLRRGAPGLAPEELRRQARAAVLASREKILAEIAARDFGGLFLDDAPSLAGRRMPYQRDPEGKERDFRDFGETDPGDVYRFFVRVRPEALRQFLREDLDHDPVWAPRAIRYAGMSLEACEASPEFLQEAEDEYIYRLARRITREHYREARPTRAAVLSCGMNSGCWKSDGRVIPWELPPAPVNIIHRRLATGSAVDQMNAHPFAELHTALTHNGETTNYRTMLNRVAQFDLTPLAQTDTAVASLKLHLVSQYLRYPFDALVEAFSPTTGWNLSALPPEIQARFRRIQDVELESAPDGPYQYLCGRIDPYRRVIERLDIIDPSLLRPNVAMLYDDGQAFVSIICSEKQGCDAGLAELHRLGMVKSPEAPLVFTVGTGMASRIFYDEQGRITGHEVRDKFGNLLAIPRSVYPGEEAVPPAEPRIVSPGGASPAAAAQDGSRESAPDREEGTSALLQGADRCRGAAPPAPGGASLSGGLGSDGAAWLAAFREALPGRSFGETGQALANIPSRCPPSEAAALLGRICDLLPGWDTGGKDRGALRHLALETLHRTLDRIGSGGDGALFRVTRETAGLLPPPRPGQTLVVDARGFRPEGIDPRTVLACFLDHAHRAGWRRFLVYRATGQRGIGMAVGAGVTADTELDVFGSPGEYSGAFNMGATVRIHNHAQNFVGMVMHSGTLEIHGDAGKVPGYAAKGGTFHILGNVVDRGWVCAVSDPRGPGLEVNIVGTAFEHLGQALMGGSILVLGLFRSYDGVLRRLSSPYQGAKILAGASAGEAVFFDPDNRLEEAQYQGCRAQPVTDAKWQGLVQRLLRLHEVFGLGLGRGNGSPVLRLEGRDMTLAPEHFRWLVPTGALEGYH